MRNHNASERVLDLRGLLREFRSLVKDIDGDADLEEVVSLGRELWRFHAEVTEAADKCKARVREEVGEGTGRHLLGGLDNTFCTVVVHEPTPVMRQGFSRDDAEKLHTALGSELLNQLFDVRERIKPRKSFPDDVANLDPLKASAALDAVDIRRGLPRVSFEKR